MANQMATMQGCCCEDDCVASFASEKLSGNNWRFTDTSVGPHTRKWTSEDGGTSTTSPWLHTFPTDRMYWVELEITKPDGTKCSVRHYIGDLNFCRSCSPNLVGETVYVTIPPAAQGTLNLCSNIVNALDGTWAIDNLFAGSGCTWGRTTYLLGQCVRCRNPFGDSGPHSLSGTVSIAEIGNFPNITAIEIVAELVVSSSASTDCNAGVGGGSATYRLTIPVVDGTVDCRGSHLLTKTDETLSQHYIAWPDTITVLIPG